MADYTYWQNALAGEFGPVHDGDAQPGFWRKRTSRSGPFVPVAVWEQDGKLVALCDGKEAVPADLWTYICRYPVTEDAYYSRVATGRWTDEDEGVAQSLAPPSAGHNAPPQGEAETLESQIDAASSNAEAYAEITDDETAAKAQSARSRLLELSGQADKRREALKRPHLEAEKAIDGLWQPLVKKAKEAADGLRKAIAAHETRKFKEAEKVRLAEEAKARAAETERKRLLAEQLAAHPEAPPPPEPPKPEPIQVPQPPAQTTIRGAYGRGAAVKEVKRAVVNDQDAAYAFLKTHKEMKDLVAKLAQRAVDAGYEVPGVTVSIERDIR